jgi:hypothetical protein
MLIQRAADQAKPLPTGTSWKTASDADIAKIARPMVSYAGPYTVEHRDGEIYTHVNITISNTPVWIGTDQVRHASFMETDGKSILSLIAIFVSS